MVDWIIKTAKQHLDDAEPKTLQERIADLLISKGPDNAEQYRAIAAELAELAKEQK